MEQTSTPQPTFLQALRFLGKLWVIVTAVIGSLVVLSIALIFIAAKNSSKESPQMSVSKKVVRSGGTSKIAIVNLGGQIMDDDGQGGFGSGGNLISANRVIRILQQIETDNEVKAVVLRINSPGGSVVPSDEIYREVRKLQDKKPVVASLGDVAASGGYYIAAGTNKIVANPASITGSIGVIAQMPQLSGLYSKIGVEMRTFKSGKFKDIGSESRDMTPEEQGIINGIITDSYDQFVLAVSQGRKMDEGRVRQLADGRIYTGKQAKENGLVDELGTLDTAITLAGDMSHVNNPTVIEYTNQSFWESLFQSKVPQIAEMATLQQLIPSNKVGVYYLLQW
jgi:protease-4